ncbi:MAG: hypothetical protein AB7T63_06875 [Planctomycetota bacterium]
MTRRSVASIVAALLLTPVVGFVPGGTAQAKDAEVATVVAEEGVFGAAVSFDARVVPMDVHEVEIETNRYGGPFEVVEARASGPVEAGDTLIRFDPAEIDRQIERERIELQLVMAKFEEAEVGYAQTVERLRLAVEDAQRDERNARLELERWNAVERELRLAEQAQSLEAGREFLQNQEEELAQLEKMYGEDDLTEETEEIVLRRTRRSVERARKNLEWREIRHKYYLEVIFPREDEKLDAALRKAKLRLEQEMKTQEIDKRAADLNREKARLDLDAKKRSLAELEEDREQMVLKAPRAGLAVAGRLNNGAWQGIRENDLTYEVGDKVKPGQVLYTLFTANHLHLVAGIGQGDLDDVVAGQPAWFDLGLGEDELFRAEVERVGRFPRDDKFEVYLRLTRGDPRFQAGQKAKVTVLGKTAPVSVHVPKDAVARQGKKAYVHVAKDGAFVWQEVETGDVIGDRIAIKKGLEPGTRIAAKAPKRKDEEAADEGKKEGAKDDAKASGEGDAKEAPKEDAAAKEPKESPQEEPPQEAPAEQPKDAPKVPGK